MKHWPFKVLCGPADKPMIEVSYKDEEQHLTSLPSLLGGLVSLTQLHVANNKLINFPRLEILKDKLSSWCRLISNLLVDLPDTVGSLWNLEALHLSNNSLKSLPTMLFKLCTQLSTLDLHNTEITIDILNQFEGWESFDERHRSKHQKQLDFRVGSSGVFDECADKD
ncbi:LRR repeats and ubiquitin-like domain-containing protein At2g30105 [Papaver somniferum]|uniref:LRR repeats and ubiquitin-like domain-containing protein At2g30105 n=1 Tax=Papaver somniferum TaxID=3469 RepID=UPI000E6FB122|nr:LRR repeats and ubiquitin-like domain-containing protein At2g30105 [Papaver somniferum]